MKTVNSISSYQYNTDSIVTIGTFDGLHLGHQKIISKVVQTAKAENLESIVLSFFPHPRMVLQQDNSIKLLNTIKEKENQLEELGIDHLIIHPFSHDFSQLSAEDFVKTVLVDQLHCKKIVIGHDHRFGKNRAANIDDLIAFGKKYQFDVEQITAEEINEIAISSTKIRTALLEGNIEITNKYLGYNYNFSGKVVKGKQLGRTIGFPTANIAIDEAYKLLPKNGVYIVSAIIDSKKHFGMMNIGTRPTINGENQTVEVFIIDFNQEIYDTLITIEVLQFIRNEQKFDSLDALKKQIENDKKYTLDYIKNSF
ncbi:MAG: bifunctional riboflavin kinase/FAD synthetase [Flavobacterium sp.]|nr:bifunctional riboflavin kinase/FAD synthetase [Flavobacterium sp.]